MASVIKAGNATDGVQVTSDNTGILELKTGTGSGTTAVAVDTSQNVGIGTSSPKGVLDVTSAGAYVPLFLTTTNTANSLQRNWMISTSWNLTGDLSFVTSNAIGGNPVSAGTTRMMIDAVGNVGIGTTSPAQRLSVIGNIALGTDSTNQSARIQVADASAQATDARFLFRNGTDTQAALRIVLNSANFLTIDAVQANNSATTKDLVFQPNGGNVGIGTSSPQRTLHVENSSGNLLRLSNSSSANGSYSSIELLSAGGNNCQIRGVQDGTNIGHLEFYTINTSVTERMRIDASGFTQFNSNLVMPYQGAPTSKAAAATLTGAELVTGILNTTGTTYTITLPTGTNIEGALTWSANNVCLDWYVINTASGTITIGANGNTTLGSLTIATGTSAQFRIRRTAANTFTVYRL